MVCLGHAELSPLFEHGTGQLLLQEKAEFPVYAFIKYEVYQRVLAMVQATGQLTAAVVDAALAKITARHLHSKMTGERIRGFLRGRQFTDFYDVSSYFVRDRLKVLNHGTVLIEYGRGLRNSVAYRWNEPISSRSLQLFRRVHALLKGRANQGIDIYRLYDAFGDQPFTRAAFIRLFQQFRSRIISRRWYAIATDTGAASPAFTQFLNDRLQALVAAGFVAANPRDQFILTGRGQAASQAFELFLYSVNYSEPSGAAPKSRGPHE